MVLAMMGASIRQPSAAATYRALTAGACYPTVCPNPAASPAVDEADSKLDRRSFMSAMLMGQALAYVYFENGSHR
jgi:hypothetical protein